MKNTSSYACVCPVCQAAVGSPCRNVRKTDGIFPLVLSKEHKARKLRATKVASKPPAKPRPRVRDFAAEDASRTRAQVKLWLAPDGLATLDDLAAALSVDRGAAVVAACRAALATLAGDASGAQMALDGAPSLVATPGRKPKTATAKKK